MSALESASVIGAELIIDGGMVTPQPQYWEICGRKNTRIRGATLSFLALVRRVCDQVFERLPVDLISLSRDSSHDHQQIRPTPTLPE
jgi:hypothetical protein